MMKGDGRFTDFVMVYIMQFDSSVVFQVAPLSSFHVGTFFLLLGIKVFCAKMADMNNANMKYRFFIFTGSRQMGSYFPADYAIKCALSQMSSHFWAFKN